MNEPDNHWVPKVHPLDRQSEADDPLELVAETVIGDPIVMLECLVQEYIWMGWSLPQVMTLFNQPGYPVLAGLQDFLGTAETERRVSQIFARNVQWTFRETVVEAAECDEEDQVPELVQIQLPSDHPTCR